MNVRRRSGDMSKLVGSAPRNTVNKRVDGPTQAKKIRNTVGSPSAAGVKAVRNSVACHTD